jgi:hypothetical protein
MKNRERSSSSDRSSSRSQSPKFKRKMMRTPSPNSSPPRRSISPNERMERKRSPPMDSRNKNFFERKGNFRREIKEPTRHLWVGRFMNVKMDYPTLMKDFQNFGEIESLNLLKDQKCAFVNFKNVEDAMRSKDILEGSEKYPKIAYQHVVILIFLIF